MNVESKKEIARLLYLTTEKSQKEICKIVGWTEKTFSVNKMKDNWEEFRKTKGFSKQQIITLLHNQTMKIIESASHEERVLTAREIDSVAKLAVSIERMESKASLEIFIEVFEQYNRWLLSQDMEFAKKNNSYQDKFILNKIGK